MKNARQGKADNEVLTTDIQKPFILPGGSYYLLFSFSLKSWLSWLSEREKAALDEAFPLFVRQRD
ncbi:hypothetical protein GAE13_28350 [Bacteroides thetaiotaomicron]|jgi:hypothetical protein|nr:hypothetical protein GAE13_28350 [Bacteroides thetaiotaomicron]